MNWNWDKNLFAHGRHFVSEIQINADQQNGFQKMAGFKISVLIDMLCLWKVTCQDAPSVNLLQDSSWHTRGWRDGGSCLSRNSPERWYRSSLWGFQFAFLAFDSPSFHSLFPSLDSYQTYCARHAEKKKTKKTTKKKRTVMFAWSIRTRQCRQNAITVSLAFSPSSGGDCKYTPTPAAKLCYPHGTFVRTKCLQKKIIKKSFFLS